LTRREFINIAEAAWNWFDSVTSGPAPPYIQVDACYAADAFAALGERASCAVAFASVPKAHPGSKVVVEDPMGLFLPDGRASGLAPVELWALHVEASNEYTANQISTSWDGGASPAKFRAKAESVPEALLLLEAMCASRLGAGCSPWAAIPELRAIDVTFVDGSGKVVGGVQGDRSAALSFGSSLLVREKLINKVDSEEIELFGPLRAGVMSRNEYTARRNMLAAQIWALYSEAWVQVAPLFKRVQFVPELPREAPAEFWFGPEHP
jgi:hypothetical protein